MNCEECESVKAKVLCLDCDEALCQECESALHKGGKRKAHLRPVICSSCRKEASEECLECQVNICSGCQKDHKWHQRLKFKQFKRLGVFWDLESCKPRPGEIELVLKELNQRLGTPEVIRAYGQEQLPGIQVISHKGIKDAEAIFLDISVQASSGLTHILLVSAHGETLKHHLMQLKSNLPHVDIMISNSILPLNPQPVETFCAEARHSPPKSRHSEFSRANWPLEFQKFPVQNSTVNKFTQYLREEAYRGVVVHDLYEVRKTLSRKFELPQNEVVDILKETEKQQLIHATKRDFGDLGSFVNISLLVKRVSLECLLWALRSLMLDEMLPSEKAIQSRIKEAFGLKMNNADWNLLMQKIRSHSHSSSAFGRSYLFGCRNSLPKFDIKTVSEPVSGNETNLIYPRGEEWVALDQNSKYGDFLNIKETQYWKDFKGFIKNYFMSRQSRDARAIQGGKYGCAQFLKLCGPSSLRDFSLGRLSYMVQLAINDDIVRYQKTFIVWSKDYKSNASQLEVKQKLNSVKSAIVKILSKQTVTLAQLPNFIKKELGYSPDLVELGFPKLKDLLESISEVKIERKSNDQPYAVLQRNEAEEVLKCIKFILSEYKFGLSESSLEKVLNSKGKLVNWSQFRCSSLAEFIEFFGGSFAEVVRTPEACMIFNTEQSPQAFYVFHPNSAVLEHTQPEYYLSNHGCSSSDIPMSSMRQPMQKIINVSNLPEEFMSSFEEKPIEPTQGTSTRGSSQVVLDDLDSPSSKKHFRASSEDLSNNLNGFTRKNPLSWAEIKPPPGFEY